MSKRSKTAAVLSGVLASAMLLTACSGSTSSSGSSSTATPPPDANSSSPASSAVPSASDSQPDSNERYVITMLAPFYQQEPPSTKNNPVYDYVQEVTGVDLQITWTPNGEAENKFNVMMAGNDMLMVMNGGNASSSNFIRMCDTGAFWDLTDIIGDYPFITETLMSAVQVNSSLTKGRRYCIPSAVPDARIGLVYRQDWVENLEKTVGYKMPEILSAQDIYDLAKMFTENDPDGNGVNDTTGFNYVDDQDKEVNYGFNTIAVACGAPNRYGYRDGKVVAYFQTEEYRNALRMMHDMYANGYLNSEFMTLGSGAKYNPMLEGRAGFMFTTATNAVTPGGKFDTLIATNPEAKIGYKLLTLDPNGNKVINSNITGVSGGVVLTKAKVATEDDVRRILQFFVDANQGEAAKAIDIGIQDIHYTVGADKTITISEDQKALRTSDGSEEIFASIMPRRILADDWGQPLSAKDKINKEFAERTQFAVPDISVGLLSSENVQLENSIASLIYDARAQYIMGFIDDTAFDKAVETWLSSGGQQILDELQANYVPGK